MTDGNGDDSRRISENLDVVWGVLGFAAGTVMSARYARHLQSLGIGPDDQLSFAQGILLITFLLGPAVIGLWIAEQFRVEVERGRMSWEVYWTVLSGVAASTFTFLGVAGIDDILEAWQFLSSLTSDAR